MQNIKNFIYVKQKRGKFNETTRIHKKLFGIGKTEKNTLEQSQTTKLSIIDTSDIEIDRNLTKEEEKSRKKLFEEINSEDFSTFIIYGDDIAKKTNSYMEIIRKRLNQNIDENKSLASNVSLEQAIRKKVKIVFNNAEINSILDDLKKIKKKLRNKNNCIRRFRKK